MRGRLTITAAAELAQGMIRRAPPSQRLLAMKVMSLLLRASRDEQAEFAEALKELRQLGRRQDEQIAYLEGLMKTIRQRLSSSEGERT